MHTLVVKAPKTKHGVTVHTLPVNGYHCWNPLLLLRQGGKLEQLPE